MPAQQRQRAKGRKIGRNKKHQAASYSAERRTEKNRKRRMRRHLRNHPADTATAAMFAQWYGRTTLEASIGISGRAARRLRRAAGTTTVGAG